MPRPLGPPDDDRPRRRPAGASSGGGTPTWVWVVGGVLLLGFAGCAGVGLLFFAGLGAVKDAAQKMADEQKAKETTVKWGEPKTFGAIRVSLKSAKLDWYSGESPLGQEIQSPSRGFVVVVLIETDDKTREHTARASSEVSHLRDTLGNEISTLRLRSEFGARCRIHGQLEAGSSYVVRSDRALSDTLVFDKPVEAATELTLEIPAGNFGGEGKVRFNIPASVWKPTPNK